MAKSSSTTSKNSNTIKTRSSSSSSIKTSTTTKPYISKSKAKGRKVRDRKDVEGMNNLKTINDLQATLNQKSNKKKKVQTIPSQQEVRCLRFSRIVEVRSS